MASASFHIFVQQLNAQGSDKADGFDPRAFDGLTSDERPRVEQIWTLTQDSRYQRELARYLRHPSPPTRLTALGYLKQTPPNPALLTALAATVEADPNRVNRSIAASLLRYWLGRVPSSDAAYRIERPLMGELTDEDAGVRRAAIARLT